MMALMSMSMKGCIPNKYSRAIPPLTIFCQNFYPSIECCWFIWFHHYLWRLSLIFVRGLFKYDAKKVRGTIHT